MITNDNPYENLKLMKHRLDMLRSDMRDLFYHIDVMEKTCDNMLDLIVSNLNSANEDLRYKKEDE